MRNLEKNNGGQLCYQDLVGLCKVIFVFRVSVPFLFDNLKLNRTRCRN